jgi:D-3-phosphoglycerate dehydrogenase
MKVLIADSFERIGIDGLEAIGCTVRYDPDLSAERLEQAIRDERPDILVVRGTRVSDAMLRDSTVALIVRAGAGLNTIDLDAARRYGVAVTNCPGLNAIAVAELAIGLLIALDRRIPDQVAELRAGRWNKREFSKARGLYGRTLGLIGFGRIGQEVARRSASFGMSVLAWSRRFSKGERSPDANVTLVESPQDLAGRSDAVSVHLALTPETRGFVGREILERLKPQALFVNTARADVVDAAALREAADRGIRIALDVWSGEPSDPSAPFHDPLLAYANVIGTHHVGGSTDQAQGAIALEIVRIIRDWSTHEHHNPHP